MRNARGWSVGRCADMAAYINDLRVARHRLSAVNWPAGRRGRRSSAVTVQIALTLSPADARSSTANDTAGSSERRHVTSGVSSVTCLARADVAFASPEIVIMRRECCVVTISRTAAVFDAPRFPTNTACNAVTETDTLRKQVR